MKSFKEMVELFYNKNFCQQITAALGVIGVMNCGSKQDPHTTFCLLITLELYLHSLQKFQNAYLAVNIPRRGIFSKGDSKRRRHLLDTASRSVKNHAEQTKGG